MVQSQEPLPGTPTARRRGWIIVGLVVVIAAAWVFVLTGAGMHMSAFEMTRMELAEMERVLSGASGMAGGESGNGMSGGGMGMEMPVWSVGTVIVMFFMWWIMMIAMMVPTIVPTVLHYARRIGRSAADLGLYGSTAAFVLGYCLVWGGFSLAAVLLQWLLMRFDLLTPMLVSSSLPLDAVLLLLAGLYQFTPIQRRALSSCRSCMVVEEQPVGGLEASGFQIGLSEGLRCLTTCWVLMLLLFVSGAMNIYWIALLSLLVLLQKTIRGGDVFGYGLGVVLTVWGLGEAIVALGLVP
ncbi:MAG: DUF2182 domain-containing protein [Pseudomonadota bacterium]